MHPIAAVLEVFAVPRAWLVLAGDRHAWLMPFLLSGLPSCLLGKLQLRSSMLTSKVFMKP